VSTSVELRRTAAPLSVPTIAGSVKSRLPTVGLRAVVSSTSRKRGAGDWRFQYSFNFRLAGESDLQPLTIGTDRVGPAGREGHAVPSSVPDSVSKADLVGPSRAESAVMC
jgi:hypothetical protein